MMQLKNSVGHRQANAAATALGREIKVEYLFPNLIRNPIPLIGYAQDGKLPVSHIGRRRPQQNAARASASRRR